MELLWRTSASIYDLAMRAWAAQDPEVARRVRKVDESRYAFVRSIFKDMGFSGRELEMRTRTFAVYESLDHTWFIRATKAERRKMLKLRHRLLTRK
jgi:hypothetical protein